MWNRWDLCSVEDAISVMINRAVFLIRTRLPWILFNTEDYDRFQAENCVIMGQSCVQVARTSLQYCDTRGQHAEDEDEPPFRCHYAVRNQEINWKVFCNVSFVWQYTFHDSLPVKVFYKCVSCVVMFLLLRCTCHRGHRYVHPSQ